MMRVYFQQNLVDCICLKARSLNARILLKVVRILVTFSSYKPFYAQARLDDEYNDHV